VALVLAGLAAATALGSGCGSEDGTAAPTCAPADPGCATTGDGGSPVPTDSGTTLDGRVPDSSSPDGGPDGSVGVPGVELASSNTFNCARALDGRVKCWGGNATGALGQGNTNDRGDQPNELGAALPYVDLGPGRTARSLGASQYSMCAVLDDDSVRCWGASNYYQLGTGSTADVGLGPNQMGANLKAALLGAGRTATVVSHSGAGMHACAILDNSTLKCWGRNQSGQLGYGDVAVHGTTATMGDALPAVSLGAGLVPSVVVTGDEHTCVMFTSGAVKCWGYNSVGQLGLGDTAYRAAQPGQMGDALPPVNLGAGRTAKALASGVEHVCALLDDGSVKCWGSNLYGQLGLGDKASRGDSPSATLAAIDLGPGRTAKSISTSGFHVCAILDDDSLKCWGNNTDGQLGLGDKNARGDAPGEMGAALPAVDLGTGRHAKSVSAGVVHTCAVLDDDTIKCWGSNYRGVLGLGDTASRGDQPNEMGNALPVVNVFGP
jgi:alpha-tubulin suppressor-like RCC1 family protein